MLFCRTLPLYRVNPFDGSLQNMEAPPSASSSLVDMQALLQERPYSSPDDDMTLSNKFFQGGDYRMLHALLGIRSGGNILYVGDHIYSDILRSKRNLGWRTCLIVPELSNEIVIHRELREQRRDLMTIRRQQYVLENSLDTLYYKLSTLQNLAQSEELTTQIQQAEHDLMHLREGLHKQFVGFDLQFQQRWGQVRSAYCVILVHCLQN